MLVFALVAKDNTSAKDSMRGAFLFALFFFHSFHLASSSSIGFFFLLHLPFLPSTLYPPRTHSPLPRNSPLHQQRTEWLSPCPRRWPSGPRSPRVAPGESCLDRWDAKRGKRKRKKTSQGGNRDFLSPFFSTPTKFFLCLFFLPFFLSLFFFPPVLPRSPVLLAPSLTAAARSDRDNKKLTVSLQINSQQKNLILKKSSAAIVAPRAQAAGSREIASGPTATPFDDFKFAPIREATVSRAMTSRYFKVRRREDERWELAREERKESP